VSAGSRFFVERGGEDQGTQKKNPEMSNTAAGKARRGAQVSASSEVVTLPTSRARTGGDGETPSRAGTGPRACLAGCAAWVRAAPRRVPNRGGAHSGPTRHPFFAREKAGTT